MPSKSISAKVRKRPGWASIERGERFLEPIAPAAVEVDDGLHAGLVHLLQVAGHAIGGERLLAAAEMVVDVDRREGRLVDRRDLGDQHRLRRPIGQPQLANVGRLLSSNQGRRGEQEHSPRQEMAKRHQEETPAGNF